MDFKLYFRVFPYSMTLLLIVMSLLRTDLLIDLINSLSYEFHLSFAMTVVLVCSAYLGVTLLLYFMQVVIIIYTDWKDKRLKHSARIKVERQTLIEFYRSTNGELWKDRTRWCTAAPIWQWKGVKVNHKSGYVNKIVLPDNNLSGYLLPTFANLKDLIEIDLRENKISGEIPIELSKLFKLQGLYLHTNHFIGRIPKELAYLPNLLGIYLFNNDFDGK